MSFTKATLTTAIQDYTDNSETTFVNNIPNFVKAAEEKILKSVDFDYFRKNVTSSLTSSDQFLTVPSDYLASFSLQITTSGSESFLLQKDVNFLREYTPAATTTGLPCCLLRSTNLFWRIGTSSGGISTPKSPLATIAASQ